MLTHEDIHYITGFLELIARGSDYEATLGSMIFDVEGETNRDVDIVIKGAKKASGEEVIFAGIEVKDHSRPLDISHIEQLIAKLESMPVLTEKCIISSSGYSDSAIKKASKHSITLLEIMDKDETTHFPIEVGPQNIFATDHKYELIRAAPQYIYNNSQPHSPLQDELPLYIDPNTLHPLENLRGLALACFNLFKAEALARPEMSEEQEIKVIIPLLDKSDGPFLIKLGMQLVPITKMGLEIKINKENYKATPSLKIIKKVGSTEPYVGAIIFENPNKDLMAIALSTHDRIPKFFVIGNIQRQKKKIKDFNINGN